MKIKLQENSHVLMIKCNTYDDLAEECVAIVQLTDEIKERVRVGIEVLNAMKSNPVRLQYFSNEVVYILHSKIENFEDLEEQLENNDVLTVAPETLEAIKNNEQSLLTTDGEVMSIYKAGGFGWSTNLKHTHVLIETESINFNSYFK